MAPQPRSDSRLPLALNRRSLARAATHVGSNDPDLKQIRDTLGVPPLWDRQPGFATLVFIILEQQVSLASARAAFERLVAARSPLTPASFLELDADTLKTIGFSRQKTRYARALAEAIVEDELEYGGVECARRRYGTRRADKAPRYWPLDGGYLSRHGAAAPRCVAEGRPGAGEGHARGQRFLHPPERR